MSTTIVDLDEAVLEAAAHLYVWALKDIPQDLRDALAAARDRETSVTGIRVLETIHRNVEIADEQKNLVCQDTGIAVYYCRVGEHFPLHPARIYAALRSGTERATVEHPLRSNTVHTLTRENTGANVGYRVPIVHWDFVPEWDGLDVKCVPKGSGSENMTFLKMLVPADGVAGIKRFVLDSIVGAGGKPCPPGIVGIGIGGSADYAMHLAKEAIARPGRLAQPGSARRAARGRALRAPQRDGDRPDGARRRRDGAPVPHRARRHTHDLEPGRGELPVLGGAALACGRPIDSIGSRRDRFRSGSDEMFHDRHSSRSGGGLESAVRVAGSIPTLGGGLPGRVHADGVAGRGVSRWRRTSHVPAHRPRRSRSSAPATR